MLATKTKLNSVNFVKEPLNLDSQNSFSGFPLDELNAEDKIVISTKHSQYKFRVLDPILRLGMLSGGSLGATPHRAFLLSKENDQILFLLEEPHKASTFILTSHIKTLSLSRFFQKDS